MKYKRGDVLKLTASDGLDYYYIIAEDVDTLIAMYDFSSFSRTFLTKNTVLTPYSTVKMQEWFYIEKTKKVLSTYTLVPETELPKKILPAIREIKASSINYYTKYPKKGDIFICNPIKTRPDREYNSRHGIYDYVFYEIDLYNRHRIVGYDAQVIVCSKTIEDIKPNWSSLRNPYETGDVLVEKENYTKTHSIINRIVKSLSNVYQM